MVAQICEKLRFIKFKLRPWNKSCFENIFIKKERVELELFGLNDSIIDEGMINYEFEIQNKLKEDLNETLMGRKLMGNKKNS